MDKRILVVGATGMLGEPVSRGLLQTGFKVRLAVRNLERAKNFFGNDFEYQVCDLTNKESLKKAMDGCHGHLNLSGEIEQFGVENMVEAASAENAERISYISGTSVSENYIWFPQTKRKFFAEQKIKESGIPYCIFRPTWFMEVLPQYVRDEKAFLFGKQPNLYHFIAAKDYARMVVNSYLELKAAYKVFFVHGPGGVLFKDAVERYCPEFHPKISKVMAMPYCFANFIAGIKNSPQMRYASDLMAYFEKEGELGDPSEADKILGAPKITLSEWLSQKAHDKIH